MLLFRHCNNPWAHLFLFVCINANESWVRFSDTVWDLSGLSLKRKSSLWTLEQNLNDKWNLLLYMISSSAKFSAPFSKSADTVSLTTCSALKSCLCYPLEKIILLLSWKLTQQKLPYKLLLFSFVSWFCLFSSVSAQKVICFITLGLQEEYFIPTLQIFVNIGKMVCKESSCGCHVIDIQ